MKGFEVMERSFCERLKEFYRNAFGLAQSQAQTGFADADFERITHRGEREEFQRLALEDSEFGEALNQRRFPGHGENHRTLTGTEIAE